MYKTSEEWLKEYQDKVVILDADGWNRQDFHYSFYIEKITKEEFEQRLVDSTIEWNRSKL